MNKRPLSAWRISPGSIKTCYPPPFDQQVEGRTKRKLGDHFGLRNFGVNLTTLAPGAISALAHHHSRQDEFIYVLEGHPSLVLGDQTYLLAPGDCCGFPAGTGIAAQVINHSNAPASFLEIGDRSPGDKVIYPHDNLQAEQAADGSWVFRRKNGQPC